MTSFLLTVLSTGDEDLFDQTCRDVILKQDVVNIDKKLLLILTEYFGAVLDSTKKSKAKIENLFKTFENDNDKKSILPLHSDWFFWQFIVEVANLSNTRGWL